MKPKSTGSRGRPANRAGTRAEVAPKLAPAAFGSRLSVWRLHKGLTQKNAAEALGVRRRTLEGWEQGRFVPLLDRNLLLMLERLFRDGF